MSRVITVSEMCGMSDRTDYANVRDEDVPARLKKRKVYRGAGLCHGCDTIQPLTKDMRLPFHKRTYTREVR